MTLAKNSSAVGFAIRSTGTVQETRQRIRTLLKPFFHGKPGPRGFFIGPWLFLWSGISTHLELVALVKRDGWTSRIVGTTITLPVAICLLGLPAFVGIWAVDGLATGALYPMGAIPILAGSIAVLVAGGWLLKQGDQYRNPMVRLLLAEFDKTTQIERIAPVSIESEPISMSLQVSGRQIPGQVTPATLSTAIDGLAEESEEFVILSRNDNAFMQCAPTDFGFTIEQRRESDERPMVARRQSDGSEDDFDITEVRIIFSAYLHGVDSVPGVEWV